MAGEIDPASGGLGRHSSTRLGLRSLALFVLLVWSLSASAQPRHPMNFDGYAAPGTGWTIFGDGTIDEGTSERLRQFVADRHVPARSRLNLNSLGGSLTEGIKLGRSIRELHLFTAIARPGLRPGECYSACALAFLGGVFRFAHDGSSYGVHRFYSSAADGNTTADTAQIMSAAIVEYIAEMGVNPFLFDFMTRAGPRDIKLLDDGEQVRLNVVNNGETPTTWTIESKSGILYLKGARDTSRGMNKFLVVCATGQLFFQVFFDAEGRGDEIVRRYHAKNLLIDAEYPHPQSIPIAQLEMGSPMLASSGVISAAYRLTPELIERIGEARSLGIAMKPSEGAPNSIGFSGMKLADGADKLPGILNSCGQRQPSRLQSETAAPLGPRG